MEKNIKLTEEQKQMVEDNLPLVTYIAKKYFSKTDYVKNQDILQEGILAMIKAIPKYDSDKAKLSTYLYPTIDGRLKYFSRYQDRLIPIPHQNHLKQETMNKAENAKLVLSLDLEYKKRDVNFGEPYTLMNIIPDNSNKDLEEETTNRMILTNAILSLDWKEKIIITYRYYFDFNQTYIGELMGMSQVHVHRLEKKALSKIKDFIINGQ